MKEKDISLHYTSRVLCCYLISVSYGWIVLQQVTTRSVLSIFDYQEEIKITPRLILRAKTCGYEINPWLSLKYINKQHTVFIECE
jgi:hypothetical protein